MLVLQNDHGKRLPTIRIQKIVMENFKSVEFGELVFDCGKRFVPQGTQSDILGIYGQNGSGKTSLIEALSILKYVLLGSGVNDAYVNCISHNKEKSKLEFTFDLQYDDERVRKVVYSFSMSKQKNEDVKPKSPVEGFDDYIENLLDSDYSIQITDECIQMAGDFYGEKIKLQPIIDTSSTDIKNPFVPATKRKFFIDAENDEVLMEHSLNKRMASKTSRSFIFMSDTFKAFNKAKQHSEYYEVIKELKLYASYYLFVVDTKLMGSISTNIALPLYSNRVDSNYNIFTGMFEFDDMTPKDMEEINESLSSIGMPTILPMGGAFVISASEYDGLKNQFESMNLVIEQLVPGMNVVLKLHSEAMTKAGELGKVVELVTVRDGMEMPLRYESDGVKKIVSVLDLIIKAYNQKSTTIAIDEFDSGIFEYLLGEILETFQEGGRGQFIFTSHNLRPLEVIDKRYLYFTTTNPKNRYVRLKNIGKTNNLRNVYYREIVLGEQDEELYRATQQYKIAAAFRKAGRK